MMMFFRDFMRTPCLYFEADACFIMCLGLTEIVIYFKDFLTILRVLKPRRKFI